MDMLHVDFAGSPSLIQGKISNRLMGPAAPLVKKEGLDMQIIMDCLSAGCTLHSALCTLQCCTATVCVHGFIRAAPHSPTLSISLGPSIRMKQKSRSWCFSSMTSSVP